jgi:putative FmdB family regulatory protein
MPLYEWHCTPCDLTFEMLAPLSEARRTKRCPRCGRRSARTVSAFAIASGEDASHGRPAAHTVQRPNQPPLCLQHPHVPMLCHMDEKAARRWLAHCNGRGAEYDEKAANREELRKKRGEPPPPKPDAPAHAHAHNVRRHSRAGTNDGRSATKNHSHAGEEPHGHPHGHGRGHDHSHEGAHSHRH